jgi:mannosyltransferase PIG-V
LLPAVRYCAGVYLVVRIALFALAQAAWGLTSEINYHHKGGLPWSHMSHGLAAVNGWIIQDAQWFLVLAQHGYSTQDSTAAFYPAYPMLVRLVSYLCFGNFVVAGYLVSNLALLAALVVLYRLTQREYDEATARSAVLYLCLFPTAFFLFDTYSESLFLLAAVGSFALARRGHWGWAALVGIVATLTRSMGVVVGLALAVEAVHQTIEDWRAGSASGLPGVAPRLAVRLGASVAPLAGTAGYLLFWQLHFHDWARPIRLEKADWGRVFSWPWNTLEQGMAFALRRTTFAGQGWWTLDFVLLAVGLVLAVCVLAMRMRPIYSVYTFGSILLFLSEAPPARPLASDARYLVTIFPLVWVLARLGRNPRVHEALAAFSAAMLAIAAWVFLSTFKLY